jgi:hypothetical protein
MEHDRHGASLVRLLIYDDHVHHNGHYHLHNEQAMLFRQKFQQFRLLQGFQQNQQNQRIQLLTHHPLCLFLHLQQCFLFLLSLWPQQQQLRLPYHQYLQQQRGELFQGFQGFRLFQEIHRFQRFLVLHCALLV